MVGQGLSCGARLARKCGFASLLDPGGERSPPGGGPGARTKRCASASLLTNAERPHGQAGVLQFTQPHGYVAGGAPKQLDVATILRQPGHYWLGTALLRLFFGVTPRQRLEPVAELYQQRASVSATRRIGLSLGAAAALAALLVIVWPGRARRGGR